MLKEHGVDVLFNDRDLTAGREFADADLIGIPTRLVVLKSTSDNIEWKSRTSDQKELISIDEVIKD